MASINPVIPTRELVPWCLKVSYGGSLTERVLGRYCWCEAGLAGPYRLLEHPYRQESDYCTEDCRKRVYSWDRKSRVVHQL